jgi:DNA-directed RNA polymerase subunit beta
MIKELQSLALDIRVQDKEGNDIELSELCNDEESNTKGADKEAIDAILGQRVMDDEIRRSFMMEDENGDPIEEEDDEFSDDEFSYDEEEVFEESDAFSDFGDDE